MEADYICYNHTKLNESYPGRRLPVSSFMAYTNTNSNILYYPIFTSYRTATQRAAVYCRVSAQRTLHRRDPDGPLGTRRRRTRKNCIVEERRKKKGERRNEKEERRISEEKKKMNKLCRQVSIESPSLTGREWVFSFDVPVPDVPAHGARIRVMCAGACYHPRRSPSLSSLTSVCSGNSLATEVSLEGDFPVSLPHHGVRDAALFPGFEVAGVIESLGGNVPEDCGYTVGDRVILYPYEGIPNGYVEYLVVHDLKYLIKIPDNVSLSVAAMLPAGALLAMNTVFAAHEHVQALLKQRGEGSVCKILIVGTGGLALWALRIAAYHFSNMKDRVTITIASLKDDGLTMAQEFQRVNVVQWSEDLYEKQFIERTMDACQGQVDVVIDFGTTSRSLHRSMQCLSKGGVVFVIKEVADRLLPKFSRRAEEWQQSIQSVEPGTLEQLRELVQLVSSGEIEPPPHTVYPAEEVLDVVRKLCHSEIQGRAILRFDPAD